MCSNNFLPVAASVLLSLANYFGKGFTKTSF